MKKLDFDLASSNALQEIEVEGRTGRVRRMRGKLSPSHNEKQLRLNQFSKTDIDRLLLFVSSSSSSSSHTISHQRSFQNLP